MRRNTPLCTAGHCGARGRHTTTCTGHTGECDDDRCQECCRGCLPRPAADGLVLCHVDTRRLGEDAVRAGELHDDLTAALVRKGRPGEHTTGSADPSPVPDAEVVEARDAIRRVLTDLAVLVATERGVRLPGRWHTDPPPALPEPRDHTPRCDLTDLPVSGCAHCDRPGATTPPPLVTAVPPARPRRRWVPDHTMPALGAFVAHHREWLAARPDAARIAGDLRDIASDPRAYRLAYPCARDKMYIGQCPLVLTGLDDSQEVCGTRLYQPADSPLVHCDGCDTDETIEWWQRQIAGATTGWVDAYALAAHLSMRWRRPVDPGLVTKWGQRSATTGVVRKAHVEERDGAEVEVLDKDGRGRVLYDLASALAFGEKQWGPAA